MEKVTVYVRLGDNGAENSRNVSFTIPANVDRLTLLKEGWAIDGNQALRCAEPWFNEADGRAVSLAECLLGTEQDAEQILKSSGYEVEFK